MATAASERGPVRGRLDGRDRLISADPELVALQTEAGSHIGSELALPQITSIARLARKLGVPIYRNAIAAGTEHDVELWVRATPEGEEVSLSLERWIYRPAAAPRLGTLVPHEQHVEIGAAPEEWAANEDLSIVSISAGLAERLGTTSEEAIGKPLTRFLKLEENEDGELPLLVAATSRTDFDGQRARPRRGSEEALVLRGVPVTSGDGKFAGFQGEAVSESSHSAAASQSPEFQLDEIIDEALRSPLDRIIESADRIVQQSDGPLRSDYADYASDIGAAGRHLLSVIRSMNGEGEQDNDKVDLVILSNEAIGLLESTAKTAKWRSSPSRIARSPRMATPAASSRFSSTCSAMPFATHPRARRSRSLSSGRMAFPVPMSRIRVRASITNCSSASSSAAKSPAQPLGRVSGSQSPAVSPVRWAAILPW